MTEVNDATDLARMFGLMDDVVEAAKALERRRGKLWGQLPEEVVLGEALNVLAESGYWDDLKKDKCPRCGSEVESVYHESVNEYFLMCTECTWGED